MSVILPLIGVAMIIAKWMGFSYLVSISWWWCAVPFVLAFIYWEFIDPMFHFSVKANSRKVREREEKQKREYTEEMLSEKNYRKRERARTGSRFNRSDN